MIFPFRAQIRRQTRNSSASVEDGQPLSISLSPEQLLWPAMLGSIALPVSFFWFGWSIQARVHWICPTFALGLFSWGNNLLYVRQLCCQSPLNIALICFRIPRSYTSSILTVQGTARAPQPPTTSSGTSWQQSCHSS